MKDSATQFTLREMRRLFGSAETWIAMAAVSVLLGIAGPFDTLDIMRLAPRLAYWAAIVAATFTSGAFVSVFSAKIVRDMGATFWLQVLASGIATGVLAAAMIAAINWLALGRAPVGPGYLMGLGANALAVAMVVAIMFGLQSRPSAKNSAQPTARILSRLPLEKRGALISMSMQDHYVNVATNRGESLVLMRLSDAISETEGTPGLQVHRSHWVATDQVSSARRLGDKGQLTMSDGRDIPVSRSYLKAVKAAGLLPL